jgi:hypothetical protein
LKHGGKELMVVDIVAVHGVAVSPWAGVDADVDALFGCEAGQDSGRVVSPRNGSR